MRETIETKFLTEDSVKPQEGKEVVYILQHSYALNDDCDETKLIGVYSSEEKAKEVVEDLKMQKGFRDYPDDFYIDAYELNEKGWAEGFITVDGN